MMERAASSTLPHPSGFGASALQGGTRLSSSSCSGSPISGAGSALLMQMLQQQSSPALGFSNQHASSQLPESPEEDEEHLATMELFRRLSHSETSPAPLSKMSRTLSCGGVPGVPPGAGGGLQGHSPPSMSLGHAHSTTGIPAPLGRFRPSLSTATSSPSPIQQHHGSTQQGSEAHTQGSGEFDLPSSITLTPTTDAMQAAGLINLALSQPGASSFLLQIQPQQGKQGGNKGNRNLLATAISVVLATRKINAATQQSSEVAMLPTFSGAPGSPPPNSQGAVAQEGMEVHVYRLHVPSHLSLMQAQSMRVDHSSSPLVLALQLAQAVQSGAVVDVLFSNNTASVALQAMALARTNIASSGQDMVLLPQQTDSSSGSGASQLNALRYKARAIPTTLLLQSREPNGSGNSPLPSPMPNALDFAALGMGSMRTSPSPPPPNAADPSSSLMTSAALMDRLYGQYPPQGGGMNNAGSSGSHSQAPHAGSSTAAAHASNTSPFGAYGGGLGPWGGMGLSDASAFPSPPHNPAALALLGNGGAPGLPPLNPAAAAANARPRARKADWVIVTEDTAIKNAAGAVAKVLGRVSDQGLCCPVFTEKKTDRYTAVVSVAVKAITVARGYVSNEGMGHELGFQPYLRGEGSSAHGAGSGGNNRGGAEGGGEKGGGGKNASEHRGRKSSEVGVEDRGGGGPERTQAQESGGEQKQRQQQGQGQGKQQQGKQGKQRRQQQQQQQQGQPKLEQQSTDRGEGASYGDAHQGESSEGNGGSGYGEEEEVEEGAGEGADTEKAEMAFDVYKLPQMPELPEVGNLPVKVTAHSRPNVVSNIITKLVSERDGAILITAGGKAMHVAMTAVVSARARLRARCCDVLLLPRFVTVDTTSTLGWESVFLRFTIVRWPMLPPASAATMAAANAGLMGSMGPLGMAAGGVGNMGSMSNPWGAPLGGMALPSLNPMMAASMASAGLAGAGGMGLGGMGGMSMNGGMGVGGLPGFEAGAGPFSDAQAAAPPPPAFLLPPPHQPPFMPPFMPHGAASGVGRGGW